MDFICKKGFENEGLFYTIERDSKLHNTRGGVCCDLFRWKEILPSEKWYHRTYILDMTKGTVAMRHRHWNQCSIFKEFLLACLLVVASSSGTLPGFHRTLLIFLLKNPSKTFPFVWLCFLLLFSLWFKESLVPYLNFYMDLRTKTHTVSRSIADRVIARS